MRSEEWIIRATGELKMMAAMKFGSDAYEEDDGNRRVPMAEHDGEILSNGALVSRARVKSSRLRKESRKLKTVCAAQEELRMKITKSVRPFRSLSFPFRPACTSRASGLSGTGQGGIDVLIPRLRRGRSRSRSGREGTCRGPFYGEEPARHLFVADEECLPEISSTEGWTCWTAARETQRVSGTAYRGQRTRGITACPGCRDS